MIFIPSILNVKTSKYVPHILQNTEIEIYFVSNDFKTPFASETSNAIPSPFFRSFPTFSEKNCKFKPSKK